MRPARTSQRLGNEAKLLALVENNEIHHTTMKQLTNFLHAGDLVVVNRSGTLPASFRGRLLRTEEFVEIRLAAFQGPDPGHLENWLAFSFGEGDWRMPTETRGSAPSLCTGDKITFGPDLYLEIRSIREERLLEIQFVSHDLMRSLYRHGRAIQYSYLEKDLNVWDQQTIFSGPPISVEPPSASFNFTWEMVLSLRKKGIHFASVLHSAGISSSGSKELDRLLPLAEWYEVPGRTVEQFQLAKKEKKQIVAVGTTVLRALESAWDGIKLNAGRGLTSLKILPGDRLNTVTALITGMHEVGTSHMNILDSICPMAQIRQAYSEAEAREYRGHEYGDIAYLNCKVR